jgi:hypothetical protein
LTLQEFRHTAKTQASVEHPTMLRTIPVVLEDGKTFRLEVRESGYQDVGVLDALPFDGFADILETLGRTLSSVVKKIGPNKASIEFGMEVGIEAGKLTAVVCQGKATANFTVKLEWGS